MHRLNDFIRGKQSTTGLRLKEKLIYLPGALVLAYGFWLSLTT